MSEIPEDVMAAAQAVVDDINLNDASATPAIARAILAERKRCADVARTLPGRRYADNVGSVYVEPSGADIAKAIEATP